MELTNTSDLELLLPIEYLVALTNDTLAELKEYTVLLDRQNYKELLAISNTYINHAVAEQISVLSQFSADLLADLHRYIAKSNTTTIAPFVFQVYSQLIDIHNNIYNIKTLNEALITRGKLQIIHDCLKKKVL